MNAIEILYVEDDPNDRELTLRALESSRVTNRVRVARDGAEALEMIFGPGAATGDGDGEGGKLALRPGLILLDLKLPKLNGIDVLRRVKADPRTRHVPVVMLTSSRQEQDVVESYELGANSYIVKPVEFDKLSEVVRQLSLYWVLLNEPPVPPGDDGDDDDGDEGGA